MIPVGNSAGDTAGSTQTSIIVENVGWRPHAPRCAIAHQAVLGKLEAEAVERLKPRQELRTPLAQSCV